MSNYNLRKFYYEVVRMKSFCEGSYYKKEIYRGLFRVFMTVPSASTTVKLMTQSFIVPYLIALVPLRAVRMMSEPLVKVRIPAVCRDHSSNMSLNILEHEQQAYIDPVFPKGKNHTVGLGSNGRKSPLSLILSLSSIQFTEGCTTTSILFKIRHHILYAQVWNQPYSSG